jgi:diaminopimelate epimerase
MSAPQALSFSKLEALGNDFMLVDARSRPFDPDAATIRAWADRHRGVGFDQLLVLRPADGPDPVCRIEIRNADGGEAEQCGNGMRAVALWLHERGEAGHHFALETLGGPIEIRMDGPDAISASLGLPDFTPAAVGLRQVDAFPWLVDVDGQAVEAYGASLGNPHLLVLTDRAPDPTDLVRLGERLGRHQSLERGANISLAHVESSERVMLRVFERGAGPTLACGSGAAAAAAMLIELGRVESPVEIVQPGGSLVVNWPGKGQAISAAGPARQVFEGVIPWPTRNRSTTK